MLAAAVCGCASGPAPPAATEVPTGTLASPSPAALPELRAGDLFDTGGLRWFEYELTSPDGASDVRFDYTTAVVSGITLDDRRVTMKTDVPDMVVVMDRYYDPATGRQVGSRTKTTTAGMLLSDQDVAAAYGRCQGGDIATAYVSGDWPLVEEGSEVVTVGDRSYPSVRYAVGEDGEQGTVWTAPGVPVPVKVQAGADGASIWELTGWG
ncbi:MAG TPA: hypothetical protein VLT35_01695 [Methanocella sp.]|nr:hypothetical protein [Methanocella sp.]